MVKDLSCTRCILAELVLFRWKRLRSSHLLPSFPIWRNRKWDNTEFHRNWKWKLGNWKSLVKTWQLSKVFWNAPLQSHCHRQHWRHWKKGWLNIAAFVLHVPIETLKTLSVSQLWKWSVGKRNFFTGHLDWWMTTWATFNSLWRRF